MSIRPDQIKNPLIRDGVSQGQRQVDALLPEKFVKVDEWELADALVFAYHLSKQIIYYGPIGEVNGNWQAFFTRSTPVQIALISKTNPQTVKDNYDQKLQDFLDNPSDITLKSVLDFWKTELLKPIQTWYGNLESYTPLKSINAGLVKTNLAEPLIRMQGFENKNGKNVETTFYSSFAEDFGLDLTAVPTHTWTFSTVEPANLRNELDTIFQKLFQTYRQIIQLAPKYLNDSLEKWQDYPPPKDNPKRQQDHPPHLALYYAFWEVMKPARDDLNQMTQKHLDFFYRKVLRLPDRPAEPDQAHLLFELAKVPGLREFKLATNTRFKAGKDAIGKELIYQLDEEIVVHKAKIVSLKGLFFDRKDSQTRKDNQTGKPSKLISGVYESPIANSNDGQGGAFPKEQPIKAWLPFGNQSRSTPALGIAIASDILLLQEGNRTITLTLDLRETLPEATQSQTSSKEKIIDLLKEEGQENPDLHKLFRVKVSGKEKDWTEATLNSVTHTALSNSTIATARLVLTITLNAKQSPLIPYRPELPGPALTTNKPVLLLLLNSENTGKINDLSPYQFLHTLQLIELSIQTDVDQVRNLVVQNDLSILDATKPFLPFGPQPKAGANLYIGNQEVFQKHLTDLKLYLQFEQPSSRNWLDIYAAYDAVYDPKDDPQNLDQINPSFQPGQLTVEALRERTWNKVDKAVNLFDNIAFTSNELAELKLNSFEETVPLQNWSHQSANGFLRLQLATTNPKDASDKTFRSDFLHRDYPAVLARQMLAAATNTIVWIEDPPASNKFVQKRSAVVGAYYRRPNQSIFKASYFVNLDDSPIIPHEPYLPVIQSLSISYSAFAQKTDCTLYHLYPFDGFVELAEENPYFLPQFTHEGELFIGLQDLEPPTALALLFQVAEETADTTLKKADVEWFYLKDNTWCSLQDRIVIDATKGLVASGIVKLPIPEDISQAKTTILDPTLYWVKASVLERSPAICQIINVHTQAGRVTFTDEGNDPNHLAVPLAAGTIAKLEVPQTAIKKVEQPYNSFNGKLKETPEHYYIRVSEHLRHKGRAVTIFDYERLVLEKFPQVYKVRCINHGQLDETYDRINELVPGSITLAVIPDLSRCPATNDLEPKVNTNLLDEIKTYVTSLSSSWVDIQVVNPKYERIQVECQVKLKSSYEANFGYYSRELNRIITQFLAPWTTNAQAEIQFGGKLYRSAVLDIIEQQDYVDYIVDFKMHLVAGQRDVREAIASTPRSVLTSGPSTETQLFHTIQKFKEDTILPSLQQPKPNVLGFVTLDKLELGQ